MATRKEAAKRPSRASHAPWTIHYLNPAGAAVSLAGSNLDTTYAGQFVQFIDTTGTTFYIPRERVLLITQP
jgi:hypothetical protein